MFTDDAVNEIDEVLNSKSFYLNPSGKILYSVKSDTLEFALGHLTEVPEGITLSNEDMIISTESKKPDKYVYHASLTKIDNKYIEPNELGRVYIAPSYAMGVAFISTNWKARGITGDWDDKNKELLNVKIVIRDPNYIEELKNTSGYLYKLNKHEFALEPYNTGKAKGIDMYYKKREKIIEEIFIPNVYDELVRIGVEFIDVKDYKFSNEDMELSIEWYNDNIKEENEVKVKQLYPDPIYNLKDYYYAGEDGIIYKQINMNDRVVYKPMRAFTTRDGYIEYVLTRNDGKKQHVQGQRLVALTYHGKPKTKEPMYVNHINGDRSDNRPDNLEWVTASENIRHSFDVLNKQVWNKHNRVYIVNDDSVIEKDKMVEYVNEITKKIKENKIKIILTDALDEIPRDAKLYILIGKQTKYSYLEEDKVTIGGCEETIKNGKSIIKEIDTIPNEHCGSNFKIVLDNKEINELIKVIKKYDKN